MHNPTAFISYSHDTNEHADNVFALADQLRSEGIDIRLDQYESAPPEGWPRWMDRQLNTCDYVLCVCTAPYYRKIMGEEKAGQGLGVRWEGNLIYQHLYDSGSINHKFIPILYTYSSPAQIPPPLKGATYYYADREADYDKLYWRLRGVENKPKPELGELRPLPEKERKTDVGMFITGFIDVELWQQAQWKATAYVHDRQGLEPPWLALVFQDRKSSIKIFEQWLERLGACDSYNELRISIIEGDIPGEDNGYTVHISANVENILKRAADQGIDIPSPYVTIFSKFNRMNPGPKSRNLDIFKERYKRFGSFFLISATSSPSGILINQRLRIQKRDVLFRNVAEISSRHDPDAAIISKFCDKWK